MTIPEQQTLTGREKRYTFKLVNCCSNLFSRKFVKALVLGQFISLLLCGTAVSTGLLQEEGVNIPTAQSFLNYVLLCLVFTTYLACRKTGRGFLEVLRDWWWRYLLIALVDVEANYLLVKAYSYTTVTSVQLLDCFSVLSAMVLSVVVLRVRYRPQHLGGVFICLLGMAGLVLTDILVGKNSNAASNVALGDVLVIIGASLYGVSNVSEEYVVRHFDKVEFLGMIGLFGSFINGAQFLILERNEVASLDLSSAETLVPLLVFIVCLFLLYATMTVVIQQTSATTVNLSILSADFYTMLFGLFLFNYTFHWLYFLSFVVIMAGMIIYCLSPTLHRAGAQEETVTAVDGDVVVVVNYTEDTASSENSTHQVHQATDDNKMVSDQITGACEEESSMDQFVRNNTEQENCRVQNEENS